MKKLGIASLFGIAVLLVCSAVSCPPVGRPDLVITSFVATGEPVVNDAEDVEVPVTVVVKNEGNASAAIFKVAVYYTQGASTFVMPFTVEGQGNMWYPFTPSTLAPNASVTFDGIITFTTVRDATVSVEAEADSDSGDEFLPDYVRVQESDETNNFSDPITVNVP